MRRIAATVIAVASASGLLAAEARAAEVEGAAAEGEARILRLTYETTVRGIEEGEGPVDVFLPLARDGERQTVLQRTVRTRVPGETERTERHDNLYWWGHLDEAPSGPVEVTTIQVVRREPYQVDEERAAEARRHTEAERERLSTWLEPDRRVPVDDETVQRVLDDVPEGDGTLLGRARAIYDFVIEEMEYKKVGDGWGNGDTHWACSEKYGNCTDYHALFTSLARARKIPARFTIGFPVPLDREAAKLGGYHCWMNFHVPGIGWFPVDASEADKDPDRKELFFGGQPADRIAFTRGRDLKLGSGHDTDPLNYFIYPHVEVGEEAVPSERVETRFAYEELDGTPWASASPEDGEAGPDGEADDGSTEISAN